MWHKNYIFLSYSVHKIILWIDRKIFHLRVLVILVSDFKLEFEITKTQKK